MEKLNLDISGNIRRLDVITKYLVNTRILGNYRSIFKGHGLEFDGYRDYTSNDDSSKIDWKSSKKANKLLIKEFKEERNLNLFFLVDASSTMVCSSIKKLKNEYAAEFVLSLAYIMFGVGDAVGIAIFNDEIIKRLKCDRTSYQFYAMLQILSNPLYYGGDYDLTKALKFALNFLDEHTVLMVVSDFIGLKEGWERALQIAAVKFDIIGIMIRDPSDLTLPDDKHQVMLGDSISGDQLLIIPNKIRASYEEFTKNQIELIKSAFLRANCDFIQLTTNKSFIDELIGFFKRREKRVL
jgi:uncharacterized protein (DUF58 family)